MKIIDTGLDGCLHIQPNVFKDERGFFLEAFHEKKYAEFGIVDKFVQDNRSRSVRNVLRGLHFQICKPQGKLVSVTAGEVFDVAVDLRPTSKTFGKHYSVILSSDTHNQLYIPPGFAHGFCVLSETADFQYKCTSFYDPNDEGGIIWNDIELNISWPIEKPIISAKDQKLLSFAEFKSRVLA